MTKKWFESTISTPIVIALLILVLYLTILGPMGFFDRFKLKTEDIFVYLTTSLKPAPAASGDIVFLTIDDQSFKVMGRRWPWTRDIFGLLLDKIKPLQPKLVCFDIAFYGESTNREEDLKLAQAIKDAGNVILSSYIGENSGYILPLSLLSQNALAVGFLNKPKDIDQAVRDTRIIFTSATGKLIDYSFEAKIAANFLGVPLKNIPIAKDGTLPIKYSTPYNKFKTIPIWQVFKDRAKKEDIAHKIVLIGATSESFHDVHLTPLGTMPGLGVLGNIMVMLLTQDYFKEFPAIINLLLIVFFCLFTSIATYKLSPLNGFSVVLSQLGIFIGASLFLFLRSWHVDFFGPIFIIVATYIFINVYKYIDLMIESATLRRLALTDELTGLFAFRYFQLKLQSEFDKVARSRQDLSLLIIDIDHFKSFNDTYGHEQGNIVLKTAAKLIQDCCRKGDIACRYGGEEFCIILPLTNDRGALEAGERFRKMIERYDFPGQNKALKVTISVGAVSLHSSRAQTAADLIKYADSALYKAKNTGRNKTCFSNEAIPQ